MMELGSLLKLPASTIAGRAAYAVAQANRALALVVDPFDLAVELLAPEEANPAELLGTYQGDTPFKLERFIYDDLIYFKRELRA